MEQKRARRLVKGTFIERSLSLYAFLIVIVPQKCMNYRKLNTQLSTVLGNKSSGAVTLVYISQIDEMLPRLRSVKYLTSLDLRSGYYHINISAEIRYKSAFTLIFGKFMRMLF